MLSVASQHTSVNILKLLAYGNGNWSLRKGIDRSRGSTKLVSAWVVYWHLTLGRSICQEIKMSFSPSRKWVLSIGCSSFGTELSWHVENPSLKTSRKQYHFRPNFLKITKKKSVYFNYNCHRSERSQLRLEQLTNPNNFQWVGATYISYGGYFCWIAGPKKWHHTPQSAPQITVNWIRRKWSDRSSDTLLKIFLRYILCKFLRNSYLLNVK